MSWMRSNWTLSEVGSHWKRSATSVTTIAKKTPIATSWTIPLRTGSEPTPTVGGLGIGTGGYRAARHVPPLRLILAAAAVAAFAAATYAPVASTRSADAPVTLAFAGDVHFEGAVRTTLLSRSRTVLGAM